MGKQVSEHQAKLVLAAVIKKYESDLLYLGSPKLYEPGFHAPEWVVAWEGGPEEWVLQEYPVPGVWTEAVNHWSIAVLPL